MRTHRSARSPSATTWPPPETWPDNAAPIRDTLHYWCSTVDDMAVLWWSNYSNCLHHPLTSAKYCVWSGWWMWWSYYCWPSHRFSFPNLCSNQEYHICESCFVVRVLSYCRGSCKEKKKTYTHKISKSQNLNSNCKRVWKRENRNIFGNYLKSKRAFLPTIECSCVRNPNKELSIIIYIIEWQKENCVFPVPLRWDTKRNTQPKPMVCSWLLLANAAHHSNHELSNLFVSFRTLSTDNPFRIRSHAPRHWWASDRMLFLALGHSRIDNHRRSLRSGQHLEVLKAHLNQCFFVFLVFLLFIIIYWKFITHLWLILNWPKCTRRAEWDTHQQSSECVRCVCMSVYLHNWQQ